MNPRGETEITEVWYTHFTDSASGILSNARSLLGVGGDARSDRRTGNEMNVGNGRRYPTEGL